MRRRSAVYGRAGMKMGRTAIRPMRTVRRPTVENGGGCVQAGRRAEVRRIEVRWAKARWAEVRWAEARWIEVHRIETCRIEVRRIEIRSIEARRIEHGRTGHVLMVTLIFTALGSSIAKPNLNGPLT